MIPVPFFFDAKLADNQYLKIGQFACRWAYIEDMIANCLRVILKMEPGVATIMIFPLTLETRMQRIDDLRDEHLLNQYQDAVFEELRPLIKALQYIRNTTLHGTIPTFTGMCDTFMLRSKSRILAIKDLMESEDLINYTAHVTLAFRLSVGEFSVGDNEGPVYALPDKPPIPPFLPDDCRKRLPPEKEALLVRQSASQR